jgi:dolichol-phosphate mannosyltransferase
MPRAIKLRKKPFVSIVIPMFNEEASAGKTLREVVKSLENYDGRYEIIFVDDCSKDKSIEVVMKSRDNDRVKIIALRKNVGHMRALCIGIERAEGDCVITLDCDLQDPPRYIPELIEMYISENSKNQNIDVIQTVRVNRESDTFFKSFTARLYYRIIRALTGISITTNSADYRLMSRSCVDTLTTLPEKEKILRLLIPALGFRVKELEIVRDARYAGESKYPLSKMISLAINSAISFTTKPLRVLGVCGVIASFLMLILSIVFAVLWVQGRTVPGWTSIVFLILSTNAALFAAVGLLGEYVGRIYIQVQNRPEVLYEEL